jgi:hypothetical protein
VREQYPVGQVYPISPTVFRFPETGEDPTHYLYDGSYWSASDWDRVKGGMGPEETATPLVILTLKEIWDGNPGNQTIWHGSGWFIFDDIGHRIARVDGIQF